MKLSIGRRVLLLVLSGSLLTFLIMAALSFYGMVSINSTLHENEYEMGESAADYVRDFAGEQIQENLMKVTEEKAYLMNHELSHVAKDTEYLASKAELILKNRQNYAPIILPKPREQAIFSGQPYLHYGMNIQQSIDDNISAEMGILSHVAGDLLNLSSKYSACFVGSKHGYLVGIYGDGNGEQVSPFSGESLNNYDSRDREWYKLAENAGKSVFTDAYISTKGYTCVTCVAPFFDEDGFAGVVGIDCNPEEIYKQLMDKDALESEYSFIIGRHGEVIFSSMREGELGNGFLVGDLRQAPNEDIAEAAMRMTAGDIDVVPVNVYDVDYYLAFAPIGTMGWSYGAFIERDKFLKPVIIAKKTMLEAMSGFKEQMDELFENLAMTAVVLLGILLVVLILFSIKVSGHFVSPIHELADGAREFARGNLDKQLDVHTGDELEHLSVCFNAMGLELKKYMQNMARAVAEKERIATELNVAKRIQADMLPRDFSSIAAKGDFDIFASMQPARMVGGDFYDFYKVDANHLVLTIADVSGKGIPASLFMVISQTVLNNCVIMMQDPDNLADVMTNANLRLCQNNDGGMFVTLFLAMLDLSTGRLTYSNGGHNPPLVGRLQKDGSRVFEYMELKKSRVLGILKKNQYVQSEIFLEPGDMLFLYTDGVTEAMNEACELYSEARLKAVLDRTPADASIEDVLAMVREDIRIHVGSAEQSDDITMLGVLYRGTEESCEDVSR